MGAPGHSLETKLRGTLHPVPIAQNHGIGMDYARKKYARLTVLAEPEPRFPTPLR